MASRGGGAHGATARRVPPLRRERRGRRRRRVATAGIGPGDTASHTTPFRVVRGFLRTIHVVSLHPVFLAFQRFTGKTYD